MNDNFLCHQLDDQNTFWTGVLPQELRLDEVAFRQLWALHPEEFHEIKMHGRLVKTPRWQQAYGMNYYYAGRINRALPFPSQLAPLLGWVREIIDPRLNGLLLNWYEGKRGHYIGKHRDNWKNLVVGAPLVTVSAGEERVFRLRPRSGSEKRDFIAADGSVFVMPYETNLAWTHEVPHSTRCLGERVSITFRAFALVPGTSQEPDD